MTTIRSAIDEAARAAIARRTEELFRRSGALREGHFLLKSGRHSERLPREVPGPPGHDGDERAVLASGSRAIATRIGLATVDLVAGPTTGGVILAFETGRQLGTRAIFAEEVRDDDGVDPARVPARVHDRPRRAGRPRRRHPDDRRLAPGDDPGDRSGRRRDRRLPCPRRSVRRTDDPDLAGQRPGLSARARCGSSTCRPTSPGPATCPRCAAGEPLIAPGSSGAAVAPSGAPVSRQVIGHRALVGPALVLGTALLALVAACSGTPESPPVAAFTPPPRESSLAGRLGQLRGPRLADRRARHRRSTPRAWTRSRASPSRRRTART